MVGPEARLRAGLFNPLSHCFMGEGWGEGAGEPAKIATVPDSPSAPVRLCIWQRPKTHTLTLSLVSQGEGIHERVPSQFHAGNFHDSDSFSTVPDQGEG